MPSNKNQLPVIRTLAKLGNKNMTLDNDDHSSRVKLLDIRGCTQFISQLKSLLMQTKNDPPAQVNPTQVQRRVRLLNEALQQVTQRYHDLLLQQQKQEKERLALTHARRLQEQDALEKKRQIADKHREQQVHEMRQQQVEYYTGRNELVRQKAAHCLSYNEQTQIDTIVRAAANEERRKHNLALLAKQEKQVHQNIRRRHRQRLNAARIANARRQAQREQHNAQLFVKAQKHEQEMNAKLATLRETRSRSTVLRKEALHAKLQHAQQRGESIAQQASKHHDKLTNEFAQKVKQQQIRYAEENADRLQYLKQKSQYRAMRQENQQQNLLDVIDNRLQRGDEVLHTVANKQSIADNSKRERAQQIVKHHIAHDRDVVAHLRRAEQQEKVRRNAQLVKLYTKWNCRAARILTDLNEAAENTSQTDSLTNLPSINKNANNKQNTAPTLSTLSMNRQRRRLQFASPNNFTGY